MWVLGADEALDVSAHFGRDHPELGMTMDVSVAFATRERHLVTQSLTYNAAELIWELRFIGDEDLLTFRDGALLDEAGREIIAAAPIRDLVPQDGQMVATIMDGAASDYSIESVLPAMRALHSAQLCAEAGP